MDATKAGQFPIEPDTRNRVQTCSTKLPLGHNIQRRNSDCDNHLFEVDIQLRFLDSCHSTPRKKFRSLETDRPRRPSPLA